MIDSQKFYLSNYQALHEVKRQLADTGVSSIRLFVFGGYSDNEVNIQIECSTKGSYSTDIQVKGKDLQAIIDEVRRRAGFQVTQANLQLAPPIVEGEIINPAPSSNSDDDEIPF